MGASTDMRSCHTFLKTSVHLATVHLFVTEMLYHHDIPWLSQNLSVFMAQPIPLLRRYLLYISFTKQFNCSVYMELSSSLQRLGSQELGFCRGQVARYSVETQQHEANKEARWAGTRLYVPCSRKGCAKALTDLGSMAGVADGRTGCLAVSKGWPRSYYSL